MVTIRKCSFCGCNIEPGTGKMVIDHSGAVAFYCSSKCEKCVEMKRSSRKIKWTNDYRKEKEIRVLHLKGLAKEHKHEKAEGSEAKAEKSAPKKAGFKAKKKK
jgi:large subunit ribosomal protein L24e